MTSPKEIPWERAQKFAEENGQDQAIIVSRSMDPNLTHVLTWGRTPPLSAEAAEAGNRIKDLCWPQDKPHNDRPAWLTGLIEVYRAACEVNGCNGVTDLKTALDFYAEVIEGRIGKP